MPAQSAEQEVSQASASSPEARPRYEAPAILWEQPFVALAQISQCNIPGESECTP